MIGIIYGAVLAYGQTDIKRLIAYTSVSHMGFVVLGVSTWRLMALQGAVFQMLAHGLATGALFAIAGMIDERFHTRALDKLGGLWSKLPRLSAFALVFVLASVGVPGMGNFIGELLTLLGSFPASPSLVVVAVAGIVLGLVVMLKLVQQVLKGPACSQARVIDLGFRELIVLGALAILVFVLGLFPQPALKSARLPLDQLVIRDVTFNPADPEILRGRTRTATTTTTMEAEQESRP